MIGPFSRAIKATGEALRNRHHTVHPGRWQSIDVSKKPEMATYEILNHTFTAAVSTEDLAILASDIQPNLPWADDHFLERVSGLPLNPGVEWANWPWGHSADKFRTEKMPDGDQGFSHTYAERMWPKAANLPDRYEDDGGYPHFPRVGIRYGYGDAMDVVRHLANEPLSRQAYLPIWFPEDTGKTEVRVPCTLGYHLIQRFNYLHLTYYIRSCDFLRHFRDDIYLTVRLQLWMLQQLRKLDSNWDNVRPGLFTMHIVSLHLFRNDFIKVFGYEP